MKRKYEKPNAKFENLEFNAAIATCDFIYTSDCTFLPGTDDRPFMDPDIGVKYFTKDPNVCGSYLYCYHINSIVVDTERLALGS